MRELVLTPKMAQKIQDDIFEEMTAEEKVRMVSQFFAFGEKLNKLNNKKINGNRRPSHKNSANTAKA